MQSQVKISLGSWDNFESYIKGFEFSCPIGPLTIYRKNKLCLRINYVKKEETYNSLSLPLADIVRSHIGWGGERNTVYKGVETSP